MKRIAFIVMLLIFSSSCGGKKELTEPLNEEQAMKEIMQMERRLVVSVQRKDMAALKEIWADEYLGTAPNGRVVNKADLMAGVEGGAIQLDELDLSDLKLRLFGNIGILTGHAKVKGKVGETDYSGSYRGTGIFIKREDGWHPLGVHVGPTDYVPNKK